MKYSIVFTLIAALLVFYGINYHQWILLYPAISFGLVSIAYLTDSVGIFGKRKNGRINLLNKIALFPYLAYVLLIWHLVNIFRRERTHDRISPDLFIGRRTRIIPDTVKSIVDLTCEFEEYDDLLKGHHYLSVPILDGCPPDKVHFSEVLHKIANMPKPIYIHCAEGHGRTGTVAAALLLYEKTVQGPDEAMALIQSARPKARLGKSQYDYLRRGTVPYGSSILH